MVVPVIGELETGISAERGEEPATRVRGVERCRMSERLMVGVCGDRSGDDEERGAYFWEIIQQILREECQCALRVIQTPAPVATTLPGRTAGAVVPGVGKIVDHQHDGTVRISEPPCFADGTALDTQGIRPAPPAEYVPQFAQPF